ncbi:hypothetical protein EDD17DRAFT_925070 [Pisolithus thermaeus]|nr:hypothetical protein EDD17DRAFT_925070 [Pisolithus thermaeus]
MHYSEDALTLKSLVAATWILDTLHVAFVKPSLEYIVCTLPQFSAGHYECSSLQASELINVLVIFVVQCFFARQIYYFYRPQVRRWVTAAIVLFVIVELGIGMETVVLEYSNLFNHVRRNTDVRAYILPTARPVYLHRLG